MTMEKMGIIIYARTTSRRLPGKVLKVLNNKKMLLELVYDRVKKKSKDILIIVNTSKNTQDNKIITFCKKKKIKYFRGKLDDVFERTVECCKKYKLKSFVRVNADRPFFDYNLMETMIKIFKKKNYDIVTNQFPRACPKGLACEIAKTKIFLDIKKKKITKAEKEHIFKYFYKKNSKYKIKNYVSKVYNKNKKINLSIDTKKDFKITEKIYNKYKNNFFIDAKKIINNYKDLTS